MYPEIKRAENVFLQHPTGPSRHSFPNYRFTVCLPREILVSLQAGVRRQERNRVEW